MILHYFKMALRSLIRYKVQNIISITGIAVGFVCFAFSMIWIKYEMSYDSFHRGADRMYVMYGEGGAALDFKNLSYSMSYPMARDMVNLFPEVEEASSFMQGPIFIGKTAEEKIEVPEIVVDSAFINMFDVRLIDGSLSFLDNESEIAVTDETAMRIFGTTDVIGKELYLFYQKETKKISAVVSGFGKHTNFGYGILTGVNKSLRNDYNIGNFKVCVRLKEGTNLDNLIKKLHSDDIRKMNWGFGYKGYNLQKLTSCRYTIFHDDNRVSLMYIKLFSIIGVAVVLISLINFFSLLVTRISIRKREIALRVSCGSGIWGMTSLFATELLIVLFSAGLIGMVLMEILEGKFVELSGVEDEFYLSSLLYFVLLLVASLCVSLMIIRYYSSKSLSGMLNRRMTSGRKGMTFQGSSIVLQLVISVMILFGLSVIFRQLHYLAENEEVGFEREGRATLRIYPLKDETVDFLKTLPYVYEVKKMYSLLPRSGTASMRADSWDGKTDSQESIILHTIDEGQEFMDFYGLKLLKGSHLSEQGDLKSAIINETAARKFGWNDPIGKKFRDFTVVGVVRDFHISSPTIPVQPFVLTLKASFRLSKDIVLRFDESHEDELRKEIEKYIRENNYSDFASFTTIDEVYDKYLTSERSLMKLLMFVAAVCIIISLFGVYSHVSLSCERRRKEIAIRKINGATVSVIMKMFIKSYFTMLLLSCIIAFPVVTLVMKRWLEQYVEQTSIGISLYISVFILLSLLILICIWHSIWKAANENPAEVIKSE